MQHVLVLQFRIILFSSIKLVNFWNMFAYSPSITESTDFSSLGLDEAATKKVFLVSYQISSRPSINTLFLIYRFSSFSSRQVRTRRGATQASRTWLKQCSFCATRRARRASPVFFSQSTVDSRSKCLSTHDCDGPL